MVAKVAVVGIGIDQTSETFHRHLSSDRDNFAEFYAELDGREGPSMRWDSACVGPIKYTGREYIERTPLPCAPAPTSAGVNRFFSARTPVSRMRSRRSPRSWPIRARLEGARRALSPWSAPGARPLPGTPANVGRVVAGLARGDSRRAEQGRVRVGHSAAATRRAPSSDGATMASRRGSTMEDVALRLIQHCG